MNAEEIIKLNKEALYSSLTSTDTFGKFFNKSILHYAAIMEIFSFNKLGGISYEKLCHLPILRSFGICGLLHPLYTISEIKNTQ